MATLMRGSDDKTPYESRNIDNVCDACLKYIYRHPNLLNFYFKKASGRKFKYPHNI